MGSRDFIVELRRRYVRFEDGAGKREQERRRDLELQRRAHRASRNIVAPPFSPDEVIRRNRPPQAPKAPGVPRG